MRSCHAAATATTTHARVWGGLIGESSSAVVGLATLGPPAVATTTALRTSHVTVLPGTGTALGCPRARDPIDTVVLLQVTTQLQGSQAYQGPKPGQAGVAHTHNNSSYVTAPGGGAPRRIPLLPVLCTEIIITPTTTPTATAVLRD